MTGMRHDFDSATRPRTTCQFSIRTTPDLLRRFRIACAEEGMTYDELLRYLLGLRAERLERQRRAMAHPLHKVGL